MFDIKGFLVLRITTVYRGQKLVIQLTICESYVSAVYKKVSKQSHPLYAF